jgi:hypothetical protein
MTDLLLIALEAFVLEHSRCGELNSAVEGDQAWIACSCGGRMSHPIPPIEPPPLEGPSEQM